MTKTASENALIEEGKIAHGRFLAAWEGIKTNVRLFGEACKWIKEKELHKYIQKPGSKKGHVSFDEYVNLWTGGEATRSMIFNALDVHSLTEGPNAIPAAVVDKMPRGNQLKVAKMRKKLGPRAVTPALVDKAVKESVNDFAVTAQSKLNGSLPSAKQKDPLVTWSRKLHPSAATALDELLIDFKLLIGVVVDGDRTIDLDSKAVIAFCSSARAHAGDAIEAARKKALSGTPRLDETQAPAEEDEAEALTDKFDAPNANEAVSQAIEESRLILKGSEARN